MRAIIQRRIDGKVWTGEEWISTSVTGWRGAATFSDNSSASYELKQRLESEDGDEFDTAFVLTVE